MGGKQLIAKNFLVLLAQNLVTCSHSPTKATEKYNLMISF